MQDRKQLVMMEFGSQVYGTSLPTSDIDLKGVFVPSGREILLGKAPKRSINESTGPKDGKNSAGDVDTENYTLKGWLDLILDGQTVATDMLFVPAKHWLQGTSLVWRILMANRDQLLSRNVKGFLGYCKSQAAKYGIKGSRMAAAEGAMDLFMEIYHRPRQIRSIPRVGEFSSEIARWAEQTEHAEIISIPQPEGRPPMLHLEVCGKKVPWSTTIKHAAEVYGTLFERYGQRARDAKNNENIDWKAIGHAVRIGEQAIELLGTGHITFPRPNAEELLQIRRGVLPYDYVAEYLEDLLEQVETAAEVSDLPAEPDRKWAEDFLLEVYQEQV